MAWRGVDLDGTLAFYPPPPGQKIGPPVPRMLVRVKRWLAAGEEVRIVTARVGTFEGMDDTIPAMIAEQRSLIEAWCLEHLGQALPVTAVKDFSMSELWDDRAIQVIVNTGERVDGAD